MTPTIMKIRGVLLCIAIPAVALGQSPGPADATPVLTTLGVVYAISVSDLEASTRWYIDKLGLRVTAHFPRTDATRASVRVLEGGGVTVELVRHDDALPPPPNSRTIQGAATLHGIFKVGIVVDDFDEVIARLRTRGVEIALGPYPKRAEQPANAIIRDNSGTLIQLIGR